MGFHNNEMHAFALSSNKLFPAPSTGVFSAPEIDGSGTILGLSVLSCFVAFIKRRKAN